MTEFATTDHSLWDMWATPYRKRTVMLCIFNFFQTIGFYGFANWVPTLLLKQGVTLTNSLLYSAFIAISAPIGPIIGLFIGDRFERKTMIVGSATAIMVCGLPLQSDVRQCIPYRRWRRFDTGQQLNVVHLSCVSDRALPHQHPRQR